MSFNERKAKRKLKVRWSLRTAAFLGIVLIFSTVGFETSRSGATEGDSLQVYASCRFDDGLQVVQVDRLPPGTKSRSVTTNGGQEEISLLDGYRIMTAYPNTDYFTNIKVERSDPASYAHDKRVAIENLEWMIANTSGLQSNKATQVTFHGRVAYGLDRKNIEGGSQGVYILFSDTEDAIITIYFLNQRPEARKFSTVLEYQKLRDHFLDEFTNCMPQNSKK